MARKRRAAKCKNVTICGKRRKLCFDSKGRITSNKPAGSGGKRRKSSGAKKKRKTTRKRRCKFGVNKNNGKCLKAKRRKK